MKGIILAGGTGSRLFPITQAVSKQLAPVYDKPMIYYPLSVLMKAGIRDVLIISTPHDLPHFQQLFQDGAALGLRLAYAAQPRPQGIAQALLIAADFVGQAPVTLILGDNLFFGEPVHNALALALSQPEQAHIFAQQVAEPERFGVVAFDAAGQPSHIIEKPAQPPSDFAVTGLYVYPNSALQRAQTLTPSARGELEISDLNQAYLHQGQLCVHQLPASATWFDTGTCDSLLAAGQFVAQTQQALSRTIACLEIIAYKQGWLSMADLKAQAQPLRHSTYGHNLMRFIERQGAAHAD
ncbi:MAG: glucose-1-phosphate thymidylyltransferase RfbA [Neisseriaceae bacterium]|nr:glucose-1-phosphate thymidylyltransferase RfbA [Neisseriaceae bacterium]MBP6863441.1 glucose-1-phosphate thymidylyltransferase RfbA [Neisseriaceae bacterium]